MFTRLIRGCRGRLGWGGRARITLVGDRIPLPIFGTLWRRWISRWLVTGSAASFALVPVPLSRGAVATLRGRGGLLLRGTSFGQTPRTETEM